MHTFWMSLFGQLLMVLMAMTLFLALMLVNSVRKRQVQVRKLKVAEDALLAKARTWTKDEPGITASRARLLEKVASDPKLSGTVEFEEWSRIANELPEWLRLYYERIRSENGPLSSKRHLTFAEWIQLGRGSLLMATFGGATACIGVLLAGSELQLFSLLGIAIAITGLQIMYAAAQDAEPFGGATAPTSAGYLPALPPPPKES